MNRRILAIIGLAGCVLGSAAAVAGTLAHAAGPRPNFKLPFACGQTWFGQTRADHKPNPNSIDFTITGGGGSFGQPVLASAGGRVVAEGFSDGGGNFIRIDHGAGWQTRYLHFAQRSTLRVGNTVQRGQQIGIVGSTGDSSAPHLHYEQVQDGTTVRSAIEGVLVNISIGNGQTLRSTNCSTVESRGVLTGDVTGDGRADVVGRTSGGDLRLYAHGGDNAAPYSGGGVRIGEGFHQFDALLLGDLTGDGRADLLCREPAGALRLYVNTGDNAAPYSGTGATVGSGFDGVSRLALGDVTGDGFADLVGTASDGGLRLYRNTGNASVPFNDGGAAIGTGFDGFDGLVLGDLTGDGRADLLGRTAGGDLRLFTNTGTATPYLGVGAVVGSGFGQFSRLTLADVTGDRRADLVVVSSAGGTLRLFANSGNNAAPFEGVGAAIGSGFGSFV